MRRLRSRVPDGLGGKFPAVPGFTSGRGRRGTAARFADVTTKPMRAVVHEGAPGIAGARVAEVPAPRPGPGEVLVRLKAAGLNHRDLFIVDSRGPADPSTVLGSDGAGIAVAAGADAADGQRHLAQSRKARQGNGIRCRPGDRQPRRLGRRTRRAGGPGGGQHRLGDVRRLFLRAGGRMVTTGPHVDGQRAGVLADGRIGRGTPRAAGGAPRLRPRGQAACAGRAGVGGPVRKLVVAIG